MYLDFDHSIDELFDYHEEYGSIENNIFQLLLHSYSVNESDTNFSKSSESNTCEYTSPQTQMTSVSLICIKHHCKIMLRLIPIPFSKEHELQGQVVHHKEQSESSPNIIFISMDDMGFSDMYGCGSEYSTPSLNEIYDESIIIDNHHIGLVCSPTRSQILTGIYAWNMGLSIPAALPVMKNLFTKYGNFETYLDMNALLHTFWHLLVL